jgi:uncharacterized damage-inducible protein DinB
MHNVEPIIEELQREAKTTRRLLERVPDEKLAWTPHAKSRPLGALAWHMAIIPSRITRFAQQDEVDVTTVTPPPPPVSTAEIVAAFDANVREAAEILRGLDDEALGRTFTFRRGGAVILKAPKAAFLRTVLLNHSVHHRGQLSVYLRLLDVPVPSIYGPSADESPAGG